MFIRITRSVVDSFKNAYQLFADIWAPITEALIHLGGAIILGNLWGLNGIISGGILSQIIIVLLWKPYYTFRKGLKSPLFPYYIQYVNHIAILAGIAVLLIYCSNNIFYTDQLSDSVFKECSKIIVLFLTYTIITYLLLSIFSSGMRRFTFRIYNIITHRI